MITVHINVLGREYTADGESLGEAICKLKIPLVKGKSILTVTKGDYKKERVLNLFQTQRLFSPNPQMRALAVKNASILFGV